MPLHDISKISPPVLSKQLSIGTTCHPLHLGLLAHPPNRYAIFSLGRWGVIRSSPFTFFPLEVMGFLCLQDKRTTGSRAAVCLVTGRRTRSSSFSGSHKGTEPSVREANFRSTLWFLTKTSLPGGHLFADIRDVVLQGSCFSFAKSLPVIAGVGERLRSDERQLRLGLTLRTRKWE